MKETRILVTKAVIERALQFPTDVIIDEILPDKMADGQVIFVLKGNVPNVPWCSVIVHQEQLRIEFKPMEKR